LRSVRLFSGLLFVISAYDADCRKRRTGVNALYYFSGIA